MATLRKEGPSVQISMPGPTNSVRVIEPEVSVPPFRLLDLYDSYFEVIPATTADQLSQAYRLRYDVYCVENAFENPAENPGGMETDAYDSGALHSLLLRRGTDEVIGTVRLILPLACCGAEGIGLPIRDVCHHELVTRNNSRLPWGQTAEISRFAVSKKLRRRATDQKTTGGFKGVDGVRRRIPDTSLGLMQAIVAMAAQAGITHLCAVMESRLLRMLARLGIHFIPLGPQVIYHGRRQPCYSDLDELLARTWLENRGVWQLLTRDGELWPVNDRLTSEYRAGTAALEPR